MTSGGNRNPLIRRACSGHDRRPCPTSPSRLTNLTVPSAALDLGALGLDPLGAELARI
jgi:hypothetical protein